VAEVTVSLGSNIDREPNLRRAIARLREVFGGLRLSPVYQTAAVGFSGDDFYNLVACFDSDESPQEVVALLKQIEDELGRERNLPKFSARSIDLDLLTYDQRVLDEPGLSIPRDEILKNAFVLKPLADLIGDAQHPITGKRYQQLWDEMTASADRIDRVPLDLD
jgi:2-amino-4-hydroxy-6-hydroxymethyldihydropteridine diphosphokinase